MFVTKVLVSAGKMSASGQVPVPRYDIFLDAGGFLGPLKTNQLLVKKGDDMG